MIALKSLLFAVFLLAVILEGCISDIVEFIEEIGNVPEDANLNGPQLIAKYGYPVEVHEVKTEDNYILSVHRIPNNSSKNNVKPPVFIMHGIAASSDSFIIIGPGKALAYLLADEGYDVWMGNARGNIYSRNHTKYDPSQKEFWQFSWHEIGVYDLPAMIHYIVNVTSPENGSTKHQGIHYIGHSQGATAFFVMMSELPENNEKIRLMISLAPAAFMSHLKSPVFRLLAPLTVIFKNPLELIGGFEVYRRGRIFDAVVKVFCGLEIGRTLCAYRLYFTFGFNPQQLNETQLPVIMGHFPAGGSSMQLIHYGQLIENGKFCQYDHGFNNIKIYNQWSPPDYNLKNVTVPVVLMYSPNDWVVAVEDVDILSQELPNVVLKHEVSDKKYNHIDYLFAINVVEVVYSKIIELLA